MLFKVSLVYFDFLKRLGCWEISGNGLHSYFTEPEFLSLHTFTTEEHPWIIIIINKSYLSQNGVICNLIFIMESQIIKFLAWRVAYTAVRPQIPSRELELDVSKAILIALFVGNLI